MDSKNTTEIKISVVDREDGIIAGTSGKGKAYLVIDHVYAEGDKIVIESGKAPVFLVIQVDDAIGEEMVYLADRKFIFRIPFGERHICYSPRSFMGGKHLITVREAVRGEILAYRNLARNRLDQHENGGCYPHAGANVETRGEAVFAARNAIDGICANSSHGEWPFGSWGINRDPNAEWKLEFGRTVAIDKLVVYERADFPHDNWWTEMTVNFSDGSESVLKLVKTAEGQAFSFPEKRIEWLKISRLIQSEDPSPFPALSQLEAYGRECPDSNLV